MDTFGHMDTIGHMDILALLLGRGHYYGYMCMEGLFGPIFMFIMSQWTQDYHIYSFPTLKQPPKASFDFPTPLFSKVRHCAPLYPQGVSGVTKRSSYIYLTR